MDVQIGSIHSMRGKEHGPHLVDRKGSTTYDSFQWGATAPMSRYCLRREPQRTVTEHLARAHHGKCYFYSTNTWSAPFRMEYSI